LVRLHIALTDFHAPAPRDTLKLSRSASDDLILSVYKSLTQNAHPDFKPVDVDDTTRMKAINSAYEGLSNPDLKAAYPRSLDQNLGMIPLLRGGRQRPNLQDLKQPSIPGLLNDLRQAPSPGQLQ
jgi:DnaJ-class molecular chaperone